MNARRIWTELFQKPAGRLVLFLLVGGIFLAFILMRQTPRPKLDNTPVASQATQAKSFSFKEDIQPLTRTEATPSPRESDHVARAKTAVTHPADHFRHQRTINQRMVSALWPAASLRAREHGRFH
jgi:hypothetical protein